MDPHTQLEDLKAAAAQLSIAIEVGDLTHNEVSIQSGHCKIRGRDHIILDKHLSPAEQADIILNVLKEFDLESVYIASWIRDRLEQNDQNNANQQQY